MFSISLERYLRNYDSSFSGVCRAGGGDWLHVEKQGEICISLSTRSWCCLVPLNFVICSYITYSKSYRKGKSLKHFLIYYWHSTSEQSILGSSYFSHSILVFNAHLGHSSQIGCLQCGRPEFDPWVWKIPWRRKGQPTPVFLPGEFHGQPGYGPRGHKELDTTKHTSKSCVGLTHAHIKN